jgi:chromosome partitioning protein
VRIIAVLNQKGGSGKTTTAVNLAAALAERKRRVLLLDLDPAAAASNWLGMKEDGKGLLDVLKGGAALGDLVQAAPKGGLDVVPSSFTLSTAEKALAAEIGAETLFRRRLGALPKDRWDYLFVDCPPSVGLLTVNALSAAREVLIPVEAHVMALDGLVTLMQTVEVVKERLNPELAVCGILACRLDLRTNHAREVVESLHGKFGPLLYRTRIRENVRLAECPSFGEPITTYASSSSGAEDYRALAAELVAQEKRS